MPAKTRARKVDPYAAVPGENGPARYNRLYAKGLHEQLHIIKDELTEAVTVYNPYNAHNYVMLQWEWGMECTCPQGGAHNPCKHIAIIYPPQPYRQPCLMCSGPQVHRQEGTEHAVRCLACHFVEQWEDAPNPLATEHARAVLARWHSYDQVDDPNDAPPVTATVDTNEIYQELYQIERPK